MQVIILLLVVFLALFSDLRTGRIPNYLTISAWAAGLIIAAVAGGLSGFFAALGAGLLTVVTTFRFSTPGGGDLKLALAVGAWVGLSGWPAYFIGSALTRVLFSLLVKLKTSTLQGLKQELVYGVVWGDQDNNFKLFQKAAQNAGYTGRLPVVPGAVWVAGGVLSYALTVFLG